MDARLRNAIKQPGCWTTIKNTLQSHLAHAKRERRAIDERIQEMELWQAFHEQPNHKVAYDDFRLFRIEDGETHVIASDNKINAIECWSDDYGYPSIPDALDEGGFVGIKTHAEWADVTASELVSTTAY